MKNRSLWILLGIAIAVQAETKVSRTEREITGDAFQLGTSMPKWENGVLLHRRYETKSADSSPNLFVYRADGTNILRTRVWIPDAVVVYLRDVAADGNGNFVAAGVAISADGQRAGFWSPVNADGKQGFIARTAPFEPARIATATDGSVWLVGNHPSALSGPSPDHDVMRHYSRDGKTVAAGLRRSSFPPAFHPAIDTGDGGVMLVSNGTTMSAYFARTSEWIDLDSECSVVTRFPVARPEGTRRLTGLALAAGTVIASFSGPAVGGIYVLDRRTRQWEATKSDADFTTVLGGDGSGAFLSVRSRLGGSFVTIARN